MNNHILYMVTKELKCFSKPEQIHYKYNKKCALVNTYNCMKVTDVTQTEVYMKNGIFWDVMPCGSYKNRHFRGT
jgi:hypothetical protein